MCIRDSAGRVVAERAVAGIVVAERTVARRAVARRAVARRTDEMRVEVEPAAAEPVLPARLYRNCFTATTQQIFFTADTGSAVNFFRGNQSSRI